MNKENKSDFENSFAETLPDVFGCVIFCDDIRFEIGNKVTAVGIYATRINFHSQFPCQLKSFGMLIQYSERLGSRSEPVAIEVYFPGTTEPIVSIALPEDFRAIPIENEPDMAPFNFRTANLPVLLNGPTIFEKKGMVCVIARIGDEIVRLGALRVNQLPSASADTETKEAAN